MHLDWHVGHYVKVVLDEAFGKDSFRNDIRWKRQPVRGAKATGQHSFRSVWQDYRGNTANDGDPLRVVTQATLTVPAQAGARRVCVRVVDVFGFEAEVVTTVGAGK